MSSPPVYRPQASPIARFAQQSRRTAGYEAGGVRGTESAAGSRPGSGPALPSGRGMQAGVLQATFQSDMNDAQEKMQRLDTYQSAVHKKYGEYRKKIEMVYAYNVPDATSLAERMATGLKFWATNYYNKSQAYLYELEKAHDKTTLPKDRYAILGSDVDLQPDIEIHRFDNNTKKWSSKAMELKTSTSIKHTDVQSLVTEGMKQLEKRKGQKDAFGKSYSKYTLVVHNDHPQNLYPLGKNDLETNYGGIIEDVDWDMEAEYRNQQRIKNFASPLTLKLEHNGTQYSRTMHHQ
jgi:hypothetical protein